MRSRVTRNERPTSSSVCSLPSSRPKRILIIFSSRGVKVFSTDCGSIFEAETDHRIRRRSDALVLDEITEMRVFFLADGHLERDGLLCNLFGLAHFLDGDVHALGDFFGRRLAAELLNQLALGADELVDGLDHVHGDANGAALIGDGAGDSLANPPSCIGGEFVAAAPVEFVNAAHQADVAFLNQIEEMHAVIGVFLGDGDNQAKIRLGEFLFGRCDLASP